MANERRPAIWSPESLNDRDMIWEYYVQAGGPATAEKMLHAICEAISVIESHCLAGRARDELRKGIRSFVANIHVSFLLLQS